MHNRREIPRQTTNIEHEAPTVTRSHSLKPSEHHINSDTTTPNAHERTDHAFTQ